MEEELIRADRLCAGNVLVDDVFDTDSRLLIRAGMELTEQMARTFKRLDLKRDVRVWSDRRALSQVGHDRSLTAVEPREDDTDRECSNTGSWTPYEGVLEKCRTCQRELGLDRPRESVEAYAWTCVKCRTVYVGTFEPIGASYRREKAGLRACNLLLKTPPHATPSLEHQMYFRSSGESIREGPERREEKRTSSGSQICVLRLDNDFRVLGDSIRAQVKDISQSGIGLQFETDPMASYLYVVLPMTRVVQFRFLAQVVRCKRHALAYEIGAKWFCRVNRHEGNVQAVELEL